jgi:DNA-binding CsgD family transcriptional regulator
MARCLAALAGAAAAAGKLERAARLSGAAAARFRATGCLSEPDEAVDDARYLAALRARLAAAPFDRAWAAGQTMTLEQAVAYALEDPAPAAEVEASSGTLTSGAAAPPRRTASLPAGLTAREAEVLRLVAARYSNREIAEALTLSVRTVERHLGNLYAKIGAADRRGARAYAARHGLASPA